MIRMGRSSRTDTPDPAPYQGNTTYEGSNSNYGVARQYAEESQLAQPRAVAESESIARDIKEGRLSGFVGHGTTLTGDTNFQMMLRVDGHLTGTVSSDGGTLIIGSTGQVDANIAVAVANVNGAVNGDIIATERIQLGRTARVVGNIAAPKLTIEDGAVFEGTCAMVRAIENREKHSATQAEQYRQAEMSRYQQTVDDEELIESADEEETAEAATV